METHKEVIGGLVCNGDEFPAMGLAGLVCFAPEHLGGEVFVAAASVRKACPTTGTKGCYKKEGLISTPCKLEVNVVYSYDA